MSDNNENTQRPHSIGRRDVFRGAAAIGGLGAAGMLASSGPFRAVAAEAPPGHGAATVLDAQTQRILRWTGPSLADWVTPRAGLDHNVVVVGGGQTGVSLGYWLARKGIGGVEIIDQSEPGLAGIWRTIARNRKLLTSKTQIGPEQANAALSFQAWYETLHGKAAFDALDRVKRLDWADYLDWFRHITGTPIRYRTKLLDIEPAGDVLRLHLESEGVSRVETTRKLVLASGFTGAGGPNVPSFFSALPAHLWAHSASPINFQPLKGKVVGILGAGGSAFDAAATAVEAGAEVHLFARRSYIGYMTEAAAPRPRPGIEVENAAPLELSYFLPDTVRWRAQLAKDRAVASVPQDTLKRVLDNDHFHLHVSSPWTDVAAGSEGEVWVNGNGKIFHFDYVIAGTGYRVDLSAPPELARIHNDIALWRDCYKPEAGEEDPGAGLYPYLGSSLQFLPKKETDAEYLRNIYCLNLAAGLSYGTAVGNVTSMKLQPQLIASIAQDFFTQGIDVAANKIVLKGAPPQDPAPYQRLIR